MKLYKTHVPVQAFVNLSKEDKAAIIVLANAYNELVSLHKLTSWLLNTSNVSKDRFGEVEKLARNCQGFFLIRILIGKIVEIFELLKKSHVNQYVENLSAELRAEFEEIQKSSDKNSILRKIRNKLAFHYNVDYVQDIVSNIDDGDLFFILPEQPSPTNAFYYFAEAGISKRLSKEAHENLHKGLDLLIKETISTARKSIRVISGLLTTIFEQKKIGNPALNRKEEIDIQSAPKWEDIEIPFFSDLERG